MWPKIWSAGTVWEHRKLPLQSHSHHSQGAWAPSDSGSWTGTALYQQHHLVARMRTDQVQFFFETPWTWQLRAALIPPQVLVPTFTQIDFFFKKNSLCYSVVHKYFDSLNFPSAWQSLTSTQPAVASMLTYGHTSYTPLCLKCTGVNNDLENQAFQNLVQNTQFTSSLQKYSPFQLLHTAPRPFAPPCCCHLW